MSLEHAPQRQRTARRRLRRAALAELFGVNIRTIDYWAKHGTIAAPHYLPGSKIPLWFEDEVPNTETAA